MPPPRVPEAARARSPRPESRRPWRAPRALERLGFALLLALGGCRNQETAPTIHVVLGPNAADEASFAPRAALAELLELSPSETALLLHLTSAERSCDARPAPTADEVAVALRLTLPASTKLVPGSFPQTPASDGPPPLVTTVKLHGRKHELQPGGELSLTRVDASPQGVVEGLLKLEFAGDAEKPATRVSGRFLAHFCKVNRLR